MDADRRKQIEERVEGADTETDYDHNYQIWYGEDVPLLLAEIERLQTKAEVLEGETIEAQNLALGFGDD